MTTTIMHTPSYDDLIIYDESGYGVWLTRKRASRFNPIAYRKRVLSTVKVLEEQTWIPRLEKFFITQGNMIAKRMTSRSRRMSKHIREVRIAADPEDAFRAKQLVDEYFDEEAFIRELIDEVTDMYGEVFDTASLATSLSLGIDFNVGPSELVQSLITERANQLAGFVSQSTYTQVQRAMLSAIIDGKSIPAIARTVQLALQNASKQRATVIARTEVISAYNGAVYHGGVDLPPDVASGMMWIATEDARTRPSHASADGQIVNLGVPFIVDGKEMRYPGDPSGGADNTVNCRCTTAILTPDDLASMGVTQRDVSDLLVRMALENLTYHEALVELRIGNGNNQYRKDKPSRAANAPGETIAKNAQLAAQEGVTVSQVTADDAESYLGQLRDTADMMGVDLDSPIKLDDVESTGPRMTEHALREGASVEGTVTFVAEQEGLGVTGALAGHIAEASPESGVPYESFHIVNAGSMGYAPGVGSALTEQALAYAASRGMGVSLEPLDRTAETFWGRLGFKFNETETWMILSPAEVTRTLSEISAWRASNP